MAEAGEVDSKGGRCPLCGKPPVAASAPFCSRRCADIDLHRWLSGTYAIPIRDQDDAENGSDGDGEGGQRAPAGSSGHGREA